MQQEAKEVVVVHQHPDLVDLVMNILTLGLWSFIDLCLQDNRNGS